MGALSGPRGDVGRQPALWGHGDQRERWASGWGRGGGFGAGSSRVKGRIPQEGVRRALLAEGLARCLVFGQLWTCPGAGPWHGYTMATWQEMLFRLGCGSQGPSMLWKEPGLCQRGLPYLCHRV